MHTSFHTPTTLSSPIAGMPSCVGMSQGSNDAMFDEVHDFAEWVDGKFLSHWSALLGLQEG